MICPVDDLFSIGRKERPAIVTERVRESLHVLAIHVHRVDIEIPVAERRELDRLAVRRERALGVIAGVRSDAACSLAIGGRDVDVVVVQRPDISFGIVRTRWARRTGMLGGGIEDAAVVVEEIAARRAALAIRDAMQPRPVDVHDELLIASGVRSLPLEDELPAGAREIGLGVLAAEGELADTSQMHFAGIGGDSL